MKNAENLENGGQSEGQILGNLEPWSELVDGANLLNALTAAIRQYVVLDDGAAEAVALWVLHTHALEAFLISPRLAITSVVMRCGKTTLVDVLSLLVRSALTTVNATAAAIFKLVHAYQPTLLVDEADTFLTKNSDLRGILNSGYRRNAAFVIRADAVYSTWAPVAVAMIGRLPATLEDRSVVVRLKRRRQDEDDRHHDPEREADAVRCVEDADLREREKDRQQEQGSACRRLRHHAIDREGKRAREIDVRAAGLFVRRRIPQDHPGEKRCRCRLEQHAGLPHTPESRCVERRTDRRAA